MNQRQLSLWATEHLATYSDVERYRAHHYPRQGPGLIADIQAEIRLYVESDGEDLGCLGTINKLVIELASLCPSWFDFSTEVFKTYLSPSSTPPKLLQSLFDGTLRQLAKQVA